MPAIFKTVFAVSFDGIHRMDDGIQIDESDEHFANSNFAMTEI
jgi:hypothetical protein